MTYARRGLAVAATASLLSFSAGCVPLSDHRKLEDRCNEQEKYINAHRDEVKEFEKREQLLTMQRRELEKQLDLTRTRLEKSERFRGEMEKNRAKSLVMDASTGPAPPPMLGGFRVNPMSGGIVLENDVLFSAGKSELKASGKKALDEIIGKMNGPDFSKYSIRVDGHTDQDPVTKSRALNVDNWGLSAQRALVVLRYLEGHGIASERLFIAGFGSQRPLVGMAPISHPIEKIEKGEKTDKKHGTKKHVKTEKAHVERGDDGAKAQNRRVEIVLFEKKV